MYAPRGWSKPGWSDIMLKRAAWSHQQPSDDGHLSYDNDQRIDLQVAVFAITVTVALLALIYYVTWP